MRSYIKRQILPKSDSLKSEIVVIGSGPGGSVTATILAEAGLDVTLIEEGSFLTLDSAPHFSLKEITQKYRCGGITIGMGNPKVNYAEGRCVGGGSEINRGLYHRLPPEIMNAWKRDYHVEALSHDEFIHHFEACEKKICISQLPGAPPPASSKLYEGASRLGWRSVEIPRLVRYDVGDNGVEKSRKQSMTETFIPRFLAAGGKLLPNTWVRRLSRNGGSWRVQADVHKNQKCLEIKTDTVFLACGAIQTPALLRRSGFNHLVGDTLHFHPMIKVVARFSEELNKPGMLDPVHQVKEFDPHFNLGCSVSSLPILALAMVDHPKYLKDVIREAKYMGLYYAQTTGGQGTVRSLTKFHDPIVRIRLTELELRSLSEALRRLCECLFSAGAVAIYPCIPGYPVLNSEADLGCLPEILPANRVNISTLHLFSSCRMGEDRLQCCTDSFGKLYGTDHIYIADSSLLCGPTIVNPQGTVMALAHRNVVEFLQCSRRRRSSK
jgi:choline dehydrogenase-like flavoprotein